MASPPGQGVAGNARSAARSPTSKSTTRSGRTITRTSITARGRPTRVIRQTHSELTPAECSRNSGGGSPRCATPGSEGADAGSGRAAIVRQRLAVCAGVLGSRRMPTLRGARLDSPRPAGWSFLRADAVEEQDTARPTAAAALAGCALERPMFRPVFSWANRRRILLQLVVGGSRSARSAVFQDFAGKRATDVARMTLVDAVGDGRSSGACWIVARRRP